MIQNIQALRGLAAFAVVLHHSNPHYQAMGGNLPWIFAIGERGYAGVDVFFVISGFVMALTTLGKARNTHAALSFLQKRLFRIFLGYWPFFLLALVFTIWFVPDKLGRLDFLSSFFLVTTDMKKLVLPVSWSLTYELFFYSLIFLLFALPEKKAHFVLAGFFVALLGINLAWNTNANALSKFFLSPYILEFIAGYFLFLFFQKHRDVYWGLVFGALMLFGYWLGLSLDAKNGFARVYSLGIGGFSLVALGVWVEQSGKFVAGKWLGAMGDASYVIYLCHLPLLSLFYNSGARSWLKGQDAWLREGGFLLFLAAILAFSLLFHYWIEHPLYKAALRKFYLRPTSTSYP